MSDPEDIRGWQRLDAVTTTSGRLEPDDIERLAKIGVKHVVNLALDDHPEALADEGTLLRQRGIEYTHIPIPFDRPELTHFEQFKRAIGDTGPVHVHCIMNWRVSAFFYRLNRERGMDVDEARALLHRQWAPEASDDPRAKVWADFIGDRQLA